MKSNIKKLFRKSLNIESIDSESKKTPSQKDPKLSHLAEFKRQCSNIVIFPLEAKENYPGNYSQYLEKTLTHISQLKDINFEYALEDPKINEGVPKLSFNKKILVLDLDETLIHADFDEEFSPDEYDTIIQFKAKNEEEKKEKNIEDSDSTKHFLEEVNKYFEVGIFTASVKEYADAVISFLDPENKLIKFRLYRNNCINYNDAFTVKDLRIFKNVDLKKIVSLDNSMYSFAAQINNGILINSFINDKEDNELFNALNYLVNFILPAKDVREVNEQFYNFRQIIDDIIKCK